MNILLRKVYRLSGLIFPLLYFFWEKRVLLWIVGIILFLLLALEIFRFKRPSFNQKLFSYFSLILKNKERRRISGTTLFFIATFITILIFPKNIAILSLLYLVVGDALSGVVGASFGKIKIGDKSLEGFLACFLGCLIVGFLLRIVGVSFSFPAIFFSSLGVSLIELVSFVDDNLSIPLVGGVILYVFSS